MCSKQRIYNHVHICFEIEQEIVNKAYTTCTYMCSKQRIYNNVHICIVNGEYTTMYIYVF